MDTAKQIKVAEALESPARALAGHKLVELAPNATHKAEVILLTVILAALYVTSIEMQAERISPDAVLYHLNWKLSIESVELFMKGAVRRSAILLKRRFGNRKFAIAMDYTDEMYYGKRNRGFAVGTKPKDGTSYAYKYFTVSIVTEGARFFLYSYPVFDRTTPHVFFINRALIFLKELGVKPYVILLDREFGSVDVFAMLQDEGLRYVVPADHDCKFERKTNEVEKFPAIFRSWQMENSDKEIVEVNLIVLERFDEKGERILHGFFTNLPENLYKDDAEYIAELYGKRWGIETAHRCEDQFRLKTTSVNGVVRYLFFVVGVLLYNLWVELNLNLCENVRKYFIQVKIFQMRWILIRLLELQLN